LAPGGAIAIAEFLLDADQRGPMSGLIFAVNMLVTTEGGGPYAFPLINQSTPSCTLTGVSAG